MYADAKAYMPHTRMHTFDARKRKIESMVYMTRMPTSSTLVCARVRFVKP